ncbi:DUF3800 domain-containing protein [Sinorhizobium meliloti]|nr:DUF3800 domain-containing protein [Sinorhizobium meliloti]MDX0260593.1 DUF3800 domain-containing protein [Sinorhizobium meliloti]MDX0347712.1 DUF3800 domain-containing protein [Sinorhizobium meliloti]
MNAIPWTKDNTPVWALVSGLPATRRERRILCMLQCFVDESGYGGSEPVFVLTGVLANAETWASFSDEWSKVCGEQPSIEYFKMSEAAGRIGQFQRYSRELSEFKIKELSDCIHKHISHAKTFAVPVKLYEKYVPRLLEDWSIYKFAWFWLVPEIVEFAKEIGNEGDKVEFVFDEQAEKTKILSLWSDFINATWCDTSLLAGMPTFRSERDLLPLQAADYFAWDARNAVSERIGEKTSDFRVRNPREREKGTNHHIQIATDATFLDMERQLNFYRYFPFGIR